MSFCPHRFAPFLTHGLQIPSTRQDGGAAQCDWHRRPRGLCRRAQDRRCVRTSRRGLRLYCYASPSMFNYARVNDDKDQSFSRRAASQLPPCYIGAPPLDAALPGRRRERENGGAISVQPNAACGACLLTPALTHVPRPHPCAAPQSVQPPYARSARRPHARVAPVSSSSPLTHRPLISHDEARLHTASPFPASRTLPRELCPFRAACSHRAGQHPRIKHARDGPPPMSARARNRLRLPL